MLDEDDGASLKQSINKKKYTNIKYLQLQSDLGYPATLGPAHIRISDLAGYGDMLKHSKFSKVKYIL